MSAHTCCCFMCTGLCQRSFVFACCCYLHVLSKTNVLAQVPFTTRRAKCARLIASSRSSSELRVVVGLRLRSCLGTLGAGLLKSQRGWLSVIARVGLQVRYSRLYNTCRYIYVHAGVDTNTYIYVYTCIYVYACACVPYTSHASYIHRRLHYL